jgi:hypothetical protein
MAHLQVRGREREEGSEESERVRVFRQSSRTPPREPREKEKKEDNRGKRKQNPHLVVRSRGAVCLTSSSTNEGEKTRRSAAMLKR